MTDNSALGNDLLFRLKKTEKIAKTEPNIHPPNQKTLQTYTNKPPNPHYESLQAKRATKTFRLIHVNFIPKQATPTPWRKNAHIIFKGTVHHEKNRALK